MIVYVPRIERLDDDGDPYFINCANLTYAKLNGFSLKQWNQMLKHLNPGKTLTQIKNELKSYAVQKEWGYIPHDFPLVEGEVYTHKIDKQIKDSMQLPYTGPELNPEHSKENLALTSSKHDQLSYPNHDCWFYNPHTNHLYYMANGHHVDLFAKYGFDYHEMNGFAGDVKHGVIRDMDETGTIMQVPRHILPEIAKQWKLHRNMDAADIDYGEHTGGNKTLPKPEKPQVAIDWGAMSDAPQEQTDRKSVV